MDDTHLALLVGTGHDDPAQWSAGACPAWVDSRGERCGKTPTVGWLCKRHDTAANRKAERMTAAEADRAERRAAEADRLRPKRLARLKTVRAEIARLDPPPPTTDRAALDQGGRALRGYRTRLTPDRIARLADLHQERVELERLTGA